MIKWLKVLHLGGLILLIIGCYVLFSSQLSQQASGMLIIASLIGLGLIMMAPFPVALVIEWAQKQDQISSAAKHSVKENQDD
ncbi:hypothetical protein [Shewanella gaetbuli]|uniref:Uncharacterized protein n=1 Tax=Shewanella gaetbuli TaxID=220752 RepID=A0A9X1ZGI1_9GAMM|nr:hypothetical protein [Shewanella gaetbuli]MCL1141263.1 hypothetical protein [Shewanella gaetbuli]